MSPIFPHQTLIDTIQKPQTKINERVSPSRQEDSLWQTDLKAPQKIQSVKWRKIQRSGSRPSNDQGNACRLWPGWNVPLLIGRKKTRNQNKVPIERKWRNKERKICQELNETELHLPKWKDERKKLSWMTGGKGGQREERRQMWKGQNKKKNKKEIKVPQKTQE